MSDSRLSSFRELFLHNKRGLLRYLTRRVGREDASDLLQETFVRALRHDQLETVADSSAFLQQIAGNLTRDFARHQRTEAKYIEFGDLPENACSDDAPADQLIEADARSRTLATAMQTLPPRCREVFAMRIHEGLSQDEIARRLGITRNMVDRHLRIAIVRCRKAVE
ncbi:MAG: RNA polymerase sigma factor [Roseiarcus sp.]